MYNRSLLLLFGLWLSLPGQAQFSPFCTGNTNGFVVDFETYQNELYATGFFTTVCGKNTGYVAKWDGAQWVQAATGGIDEGHALTAIDDALFIATYEFGTDSNYVVRWNGTNLSTIGTVYRSNPDPNQSKTASVYDIIKYDDQIVACGEFDRVAGKPISGIARWDGAQWDSLGSGLGGSLPGTPAILYPHQMAVFDGDLIVCGNFAKAGGQTVNGIARWDGQAWHPLGPGFNNTVYGIGVFNGVLYAGGAFTASGNTMLGRIARWNGTAWEHPGFELLYSTAGVQSFVHTLRQIGDSLYVTGGFNRVKLSSGSQVNASGVVVLNAAQQVNTLGGGTPNQEIEAVIPYNNGVLVGGGTFNKGYLGFWNVETSSVGDGADQPGLKIYPNPASTMLNVSGWETSGFTELSLFDAPGRQVVRLPLTASLTGVPLTDLPGGIYFVQFSGSKRTEPCRHKVLILRE